MLHQLVVAIATAAGACGRKSRIASSRVAVAWPAASACTDIGERHISFMRLFD